MPYFGVPIRNGLPIGLGSQAGFGIAPFSPADLFSAGEQGAWYDPSDYSTLFTDSAGTTPVTGVEQFVGLMLDKSKGLVLGSELVANPGPGFTTTTGWTSGRAATLSVVSGAIRVTNTTAYGQAYATITTVVGTWYKVTVSATNPTTTFDIFLGSTGPETGVLYQKTNNAAGTYTFYFLATTATSYLTVGNSAATAGPSFDLVSATLKALPGNHAFQTTSAKRPVLRARYNLLTYSEQFDNAAWQKGSLTVSANAAVAPDGTTTADKLNENTANAEHFAVQTLTLAATQYTASVYLKAAERTWASVYLSLGPIASTWFNLAADGSGGVGTVASGVTATSQYVGNGWYRCTITRTTTAASWSLVINPALGDGISVIYAGTLNSGILAWGADLRPASQATGLIGPTYQRVVDAATYDTVGFLPYLQFDGIDDSMSTGSIDFTATDKMTVWAGVRKLSDAALGMLAETSAVANSNNGAIAVGAPGWNPVAARYGSLIKGTSANALYANSPASFASPITNVLAMQYNLAGASNSDVMQMRLNAASQSLTFFDGPASGGNFGNYPLYIGMRNNASFPFNGWLTSLIVRGAQSTQSQIEATESWVNQRTGAF